jgi:hypothetical protein
MYSLVLAVDQYDLSSTPLHSEEIFVAFKRDQKIGLDASKLYFDINVGPYGYAVTGTGGDKMMYKTDYEAYMRSLRRVASPIRARKSPAKKRSAPKKRSRKPAKKRSRKPAKKRSRR